MAANWIFQPSRRGKRIEEDKLRVGERRIAMLCRVCVQLEVELLDKVSRGGEETEARRA